MTGLHVKQRSKKNQLTTAQSHLNNKTAIVDVMEMISKQYLVATCVSGYITTNSMTDDKIVQLVCITIAKYKQSKNIMDWEQLRDADIDNILDSLRMLIHKHEGLWKK